MKTYNVNDIKTILKSSNIIGNKNVEFSSADPIESANEHSIVWINSNRTDKYNIINQTKARIIICDSSVEITEQLKSKKCFIIVDNPRLAFSRIIESFFYFKKIDYGIHPTAIIDPKARIHKKTFIGPYTYIGNVIIGENCFVDGHSFIYDNVTIGKNVIIHAHTVIGSDGFGFVRDDNKELIKFLHIGNVVIEDNVEIFPFVNIDKGALGETRIKKGSKIDHYCHIGHNTLVGENSLLTAGVILCGGSKIGNNVWIGVGSIIKEKIIVEDNALIGIGSVVTKNIPNGETWTGLPARRLDEFLKLQEEFKQIIKK